MEQIKKYLVVEDTPVQAIMLRRALIQAGFDVVTVKNGIEALNVLKTHTFSLVISDVNMPLMNGFELLSCN